MPEQMEKLRNLLIHHADSIKGEYEFPWLDERPLSMENSNKFFLGAIMDYQEPADRVWSNAAELAQLLGTGNLWQAMVSMPEGKWLSLRKADGGHFHRFWQANGERSIARRLRRIAKNVMQKFSGDVRNIWKDKTAKEVYEALRYDVRVNLSDSDASINMIIGALISYKHIVGIGDVKADMHVQKVLGRIFDETLGSESATELARKIHPDNPWELDLALYDIGKNYCGSNWSYCEDCPVSSECRSAVI